MKKSRMAVPISAITAVWVVFVSGAILAYDAEDIVREYGALAEALIYSLPHTTYLAGYNAAEEINELVLKNILKNILYPAYAQHSPEGLQGIRGLEEIARKSSLPISGPTQRISRSIPLPGMPSLSQSRPERLPGISGINEASSTGSFTVNAVGSLDSENVVKLAIIDIDGEHAALVRETLENTLVAANPNARFEIATIILPGKMEADGAKLVSSYDFASGLYQAKEWGAQIVNMSIGPSNGGDLGGPVLTALEELNKNNVLVVASAGNDGGGDAWAGAASPYVLSVGALDSSGAKAEYSDTSSDGVYVPVIGKNLGTSFAAPVVAGEAALRIAENKNSQGKYLNSGLAKQSAPATYARDNNTEMQLPAEILLILHGRQPQLAPEISFEGLGLVSPQYNNQFPSVFVW
jgi:subtilisin family serine protease